MRQAHEGIRIEYLPANQAHAFFFGDQILQMNGRFLFPDIIRARSAAREMGIHLNTDGTCVSESYNKSRSNL